MALILKQWLKQLPLMKQLSALRRMKKQLANTQQQLSLATNKISYLLKQQLNKHQASTYQGVIISLTSFGQRIDTVHLTLLSLLTQSVGVEKIILWLSKDEITPNLLPKQLTALENYGVSIAFCEELGSYKKLIPCLKKYPNKTIITFDDDVIYAHDQVEKLLASSKKYPKAIVCHHARKMSYDQNSQINPYKEWPFVTNRKEEEHIVPIGVGGVLYPANSLHQEVINDALFLTLAPKADDLWFNAMAVKNNTRIVMVDDPKPFENYLLIPSTQDNALWHANSYNNDQQLKNILRHYPEINNALRQHINSHS